MSQFFVIAQLYYYAYYCCETFEGNWLWMDETILTCSSDKVLAGEIIAVTMMSMYNLLKTIYIL